jgi:3-carboxy-cis,cis-muconate cycloisomerase
METIDERDASTWYAEFAVIPNAFLYMSRLLQNVTDLLDNFEVHPENMAENMDIHGDLVVSERIMMALAEEIGRQTAHDVVAENAWEALDSGRSFGSVLRDDERVTDALSESELEELLDASTYTGLSGTFVDRVLEHSSGQ